MYVIEKGVPILHAGRYGFLNMEVGDSILVTDRHLRAVQYSVSKHNQRYPDTLFITRSLGDSKTRVWRIK